MQFLFQRKAGGRLGYPVCTVCSDLTFSCRLCSVSLRSSHWQTHRTNSARPDQCQVSVSFSFPEPS